MHSHTTQTAHILADTLTIGLNRHNFTWSQDSREPNYTQQISCNNPIARRIAISNSAYVTKTNHGRQFELLSATQ